MVSHLARVGAVARQVVLPHPKQRSQAGGRAFEDDREAAKRREH